MVNKEQDVTLKGKWLSLTCKWLFDKGMACLLLVLLSPVFAYLAYRIKKDSPGPVFFKQKRVTKNGKVFNIYKFRTMVVNAASLGSAVTVDNDARITAIGHKIRGKRLDELPQLINVLKGDMSFVGTRPEVEKYVAMYTDEMRVTLLLPAGITSTASVLFKEEDSLLSEYVAQGLSVDQAYVQHILPKKMAYNIKDIEQFSFVNDIKILWLTVKHVLFTKTDHAS